MTRKLMLRYYCDACGKEIQLGQLNIVKVIVPNEKTIEKDFCPNCIDYIRLAIKEDELMTEKEEQCDSPT